MRKKEKKKEFRKNLDCLLPEKTMVKKMEIKSNYIAIFITLLFIGCVCVWVVDNCVSAMLSGGYLSNGLFDVSAMKMYHIGLYGILAVLVLTCIFISHYILVGRIHSNVD